MSDRFAEGARAATRDRTGRRRDEALVAYVREADEMAASDSRVGDLCHPAMHQLGRTEGDRSARLERLPLFPRGSTQLCTAGYVHGLSEGYLAGTPDADVAAVFPKLCHDDAARTGCAHGIGHALLRARSGDAPDPAADAAVERCGELPSTVHVECANGVFMELAMRRSPERVPVRSFVSICDARTDVQQQLACFGYLDLSFTTNDSPLKDVPAWCGRAPVPAQFPCIEGYGRSLGVERVASCEKVGRKAIEERCIDGAIGLQVGSGHVSPAAAKRSCEVLDSGSLEGYCTHAVERYDRGRRATT